MKVNVSQIALQENNIPESGPSVLFVDSILSHNVSHQQLLQPQSDPVKYPVLSLFLFYQCLH